MQLSFERHMQCSPEVAFSLVTDPARMNLWSTAPVHSVSLGDGSHPAGVGALRQVHVPGPGRRILDEVVLVSEPPHRFVYKVIGGAPVESHIGEQRFEPNDRGTRLTWTVDIKFRSRIVEALAKRMLLPELAHSLNRLPEAARVANDGTLPPVRDLPEVELRSLYRAAEACRDEQQSLADAFDQYQDDKRWFTRVYQYVTEEQLAACRGESFGHSAWVLRLITAFHRYYVENLRAYLRQDLHRVERHWLSAFTAMDGARRTRRNPLDIMGYAVAKGMQAHIEEDLPRALAEVYHQHFSPFCDYARFRADYLTMAGIFQRAGDRLLADVPKRSWTIAQLVSSLMLPAATKNRLAAKSHYDIRRQRRKAFERGERIAELLRAQTPVQ